VINRRYDEIARRAYERFLHRAATDGDALADWLMAEREAALLPGFNIGILIIGSLFWSEKAHRVRWRDERLMVDSAMQASAPIRYGRQSRDGTFTMVFSNALTPDHEGTALVVPCQYPATTAEALIREAEALWAAEQPEERLVGAISNRAWGAVGLLCNPARTAQLSELCTAWTSRVMSERESYRAFPEGLAEARPVTEDGILTVPWPGSTSAQLDRFDFLLATANHPRPFAEGTYATAETIARAWRDAGDRHYFDKNRGVGIQTTDDNQIIGYLDSD